MTIIHQIMHKSILGQKYLTSRSIKYYYHLVIIIIKGHIKFDTTTHQYNRVTVPLILYDMEK